MKNPSTTGIRSTRKDSDPSSNPTGIYHPLGGLEGGAAGGIVRKVSMENTPRGIRILDGLALALSRAGLVVSLAVLVVMLAGTAYDVVSRFLFANPLSVSSSSVGLSAGVHVPGAGHDATAQR